MNSSIKSGSWTGSDIAAGKNDKIRNEDKYYNQEKEGN